MRTGHNGTVLIGRSSHRATLEFLDEMRGGKAAEPTELIRSQRLIILGAERPKEGMVQKRGQAPRRNAFSPRLRAIGSEPVPIFEPCPKKGSEQTRLACASSEIVARPVLWQTDSILVRPPEICGRDILSERFRRQF